MSGVAGGEPEPDVFEITRAFDDIESWEGFLADHRFLCEPGHVQRIVEHALAHGVASAFLGPVGPDQVRAGDANYRESLMAAGLNPRQRAMLDLVAGEPWFGDPAAARVYASEALTPFALAMRGRFPRFIGSEYASGETNRQALYPIPVEDLTRLSLRSDAFDCVITNDVLEHIPDIPAGLGEMARVLRRGGMMLSTFPFSFRRENIVKARLVGDEIEFLAEPEYHGNPAEPETGSLVFEIPGWQILEAARDAGFSHAEMVFVSSLQRGITGAEIAGIFIMRCYK